MSGITLEVLEAKQRSLILSYKRRMKIFLLHFIIFLPEAYLKNKCADFMNYFSTSY